MTPDAWVQVKAIVQEALEHPPDARAAFVSEACAGNFDLRRDVDSLLAASARKLRRGDRLGPYEIVDALGAGGMGEKLCSG